MMPLATRLRLHETTSVKEALITLWVFATLAVFIPAAIIRSTGIPTNSYWLWSLPATVICAARFAWLVGTGERRLFEVTFWGFSYAFLGLAPLTQLRDGYFPVTVPRVDATYTAAAALIVIASALALIPRDIRTKRYVEAPAPPAPEEVRAAEALEDVALRAS